jgi:hypothetical protein
MSPQTAQIQQLHQQWLSDAANIPNANRLIGVTLTTAMSLVEAERYDDALEVLDWLWTKDGFPAAARVAGLRAMAVVHRAKGNSDAAENCERWAVTFAPKV